MSGCILPFKMLSAWAHLHLLCLLIHCIYFCKIKSVLGQGLCLNIKVLLPQPVSLDTGSEWAVTLCSSSERQSQQQNGSSLLPLCTRISNPHSHSVCTRFLQFANINSKNVLFTHVHFNVSALLIQKYFFMFSFYIFLSVFYTLKQYSSILSCVKVRKM